MINRLCETRLYALIAFRADSTLEAAFRLLPDLFFTETEGNLIKISLAFFQGELSHGGSVHKRFFCDFRFFVSPVSFPPLFQIEAVYVTVNTLCGLFSAFHCFHHRSRPVEDISPCKDTFKPRLRRRFKSNGIGLESSLLACGDTLLFGKCKISGLADSHDDSLTFKGGQVGFVILRIKATLIIEHRGACHKFYTGELPVFLDEPLWSETVGDMHPLLKGLIDLVIPGRHFVSFL